MVNQLLTELDGLETRKDVYIIAATNRWGESQIAFRYDIRNFYDCYKNHHDSAKSAMTSLMTIESYFFVFIPIPHIIRMIIFLIAIEHLPVDWS